MTKQDAWQWRIKQCLCPWVVSSMVDENSVILILALCALTDTFVLSSTLKHTIFMNKVNLHIHFPNKMFTPSQHETNGKVVTYIKHIIS